MIKLIPIFTLVLCSCANLPEYKKTFVNIFTGEIKETTDLRSKLFKRDSLIIAFSEKYIVPFRQKRITIFSVVVNQNEYSSITKFINTVTRKLKRRGVERLGYVWVRDVGDKCYKHFHVLIATTRIDEKDFNQLFNKKKNNDYEVQFLKSPKGMKKYLNEKNLYGERRQRTYGKSRKFLLPKNNQIQYV